MHTAGDTGGVATEAVTAWRRQCHASGNKLADLFDVQSQLSETMKRQLMTSVEMYRTSALASACLVAQRKDS